MSRRVSAAATQAAVHPRSLADGFVATDSQIAATCKLVQVPVNTANRAWPKPPLVHPGAGKWKFLAAGLLQVGSTDGVVNHRPRPLLSVREAARLLRVSTATVYKLCADGDLPHARILNAIRIAPGDLALFVQARRG